MKTRFPIAWSELTTIDFNDGALGRAVAILPVAAIEQHGPHLPLGTDAIINQGVLDAALAGLPSDLPVVVLPAQQIGTSKEHLGFPGTLTLDAPTLIRLWTEIGEGVHRAGLTKLLIFNSHGGQSGLIEAVAVDLRARLGMLVAWASPGAFGTPDGTIPPDEAQHGLHGGTKETAMMLHLRPDLVRLERARDFASLGQQMAAELTRLRPTGRTGFGWLASDLNPAGVVGDASAADAALGKRLVEHAAAGLVELIRDLVAFEPG